MVRKPTEVAHINFRIRESLRRKLEVDAKRNRVSLNAEMRDGLEQSYAATPVSVSQNIDHQITLMETAWLRLSATHEFLSLVDLLTAKIIDHDVRDELGRSFQGRRGLNSAGDLLWPARELQRLRAVIEQRPGRSLAVGRAQVMSGSLRQRSPGSWELKFEAGVDPPTSERKTVYRTFRGTKRQAQARLVELQSEAARGTLVDYRKETLGEFLERWDRAWASINVSPKTRERWNQLRVNQVNPALGNARCNASKPVTWRRCTPLDARGRRRRRASGGEDGRTCSPSVAPRARACAGLEADPAIRRRSPVRRAWSTTRRSTSRPRRRSPSCSSVCATAIRCSMPSPCWRWRPAPGAASSAACAGKTSTLTLACCRIERSVETTAEGERLKGPKTRHGKRAIGLPASAVRELRAHWRAQQEERLSHGLGRARPTIRSSLWLTDRRSSRIPFSHLAALDRRGRPADQSA